MPTEIISGLWIGNINDIYNEEFYNDNLINICINCTIDQGFLDLPNIKKIRLSLSEEMDPNRDIYMLKENLNKILEFIHNSIEENNIFIYCYNGITISPLIIGLYMIKYGGISPNAVPIPQKRTLGITLKKIHTPIKSSIGNHDNSIPKSDGILSSCGEATILTPFEESLSTRSG